MLSKDYPKIIKIPCPRCKVGPDSKCLMKIPGGSKYREIPHTERVLKAGFLMDKYERRDNDY